MQGGEGIRVSSAAVSGGSITVNVGPNDSTVEVGIGGDGKSIKYQVAGNKDASVPVPVAPPGSILVVRVGKGPRKRRILVTIVAPGP